MTPPRLRCLGTGFERLESRDVPAAFGIPWADSGHLSLSFVPDGTPTPNGPSALFRTLDSVAPTAVWEREILRAIEAWASRVNVDVGVVPDSGAPLGTLGAVQGDRRFGDIRIAAVPLANSAELASASAFSWTGTTFSGDIVFDSSRPFRIGNSANGYDLFSVTLHEAGHVLGLDHSSAKDSVLQEGYSYLTGLGAGDIQQVQGLYGARAADAFDAAKANDSSATASAIPKDQTVAHRLTARGDLTTAADLDYFKFTVPLLGGVTGVSVRLTAAGQSLLTPTVAVYDSAGRVVASGQSADPTRNDVSLSFGPGLFGGSYTVKIDGATQEFGIGGYQLTVDFLTVDSLLAPVTNLLAPVLDLHTNDLLGAATVLAPQPRTTPDARFDYIYRGAIEDSTDVDYYEIRSPGASSSAPLNLNAIVWGLNAAPLNPRLRVFDAAGRAVAFQVLANDAGIFSIQVLNVKPDADYFLQVAARDAGSANRTGSYFLGADFNSFAPTAFEGVGAGTLNPSGVTTDSLKVGTSGLFSFALAAEVLQAGGGGGVTMSVIDASGKTDFTLTTEAGQPPRTTIQYLAAGSYTVRYSWVGAKESTSVPVRFNLFLLTLSDPVGPQPTTTSSTAPSESSSSSSPPSNSSPPPSSEESGYTYSSSSTTRSDSYWYSF